MRKRTHIDQLAAWVSPLLGAHVAMSVAAIGSELWLWSTFSDPLGADATSVRGSIDLYDTIRYLRLALVVVTATVFLRWLGRGYRNLHGVAVGRMPASPTFAIIAWFIPLVALVAGYKVVDALWRGTDPEEPGDLSRPGSPLVRWWWTAYLAAGAAGWLAATNRADAVTLEASRRAIPVSILASVLVIAAALLARAMVRAVTARHDAAIDALVRERAGPSQDMDRPQAATRPPKRSRPIARVGARLTSLASVRGGAAIAIAAVLLLDGLAIAVHTEADGARVVAPRPPSAEELALAAVVDELQVFVEGARGLRFRAPVDVRLVPSPRFDDLLSAEADIGPDIGPLRDLGVIDGADPVGRHDEAGILGFYDDVTKQLTIRSTTITPLVRLVIVHELTHALDDQHFGLHRPELANRDDESALAFIALAEGDAVSVEEAYFDSLAADVKRAIESAVDSEQPIDTGGSTVSVRSVRHLHRDFTTQDFVYGGGGAFVADLIKGGGRAAVDKAFARPPISSAQILHPDLYRRAVLPIIVPDAIPPAGAVVSSSQVLGEIGVALMLQEHFSHDAFRYASTWAGDRLVAWESAGVTCASLDIATTTPDNAAFLVEALTTWVYAHGSASVQHRPSVVNVRSCGPHQHRIYPATPAPRPGRNVVDMPVEYNPPMPPGDPGGSVYIPPPEEEPEPIVGIP